MAIQSFGDKETEKLFLSGQVAFKAKWKKVAKIAIRKLDMIDYAEKILDLKSPPGNKLKALKGDWKGFYSIRINDQWRVVFQWSDRGPERVSIVDYH